MNHVADDLAHQADPSSADIFGEGSYWEVLSVLSLWKVHFKILKDTYLKAS